MKYMGRVTENDIKTVGTGFDVKSADKS